MELNPAVAIEKSKFFNVYTSSYKAVNHQAISVIVQIPKNVKPGKHPLLVRFHGGGLVTGAPLFMGFYAPWIMDYALAYEAVIVLPNYRLLPESTGLDLMEDLSDFWQWTHGGLQALVSSSTQGQVEVDLSKTLVQGESSGGYLAIQSGLTQPPHSIKAIVASYPMIDIKSPWFSESYEKSLFNTPMLPVSVLDDHLAKMRPGEIVCSAEIPDRLDLMFVMFQQGLYRKLLGEATYLYPMETIESTRLFPPLFIYHGREDSVVPAEGTEKFVEKFKRLLPKAKVVFKLESGDHGLDVQTDIKEPWLQEGLQLVTLEWLS